MSFNQGPDFVFMQGVNTDKTIGSLMPSRIGLGGLTTDPNVNSQEAITIDPHGYQGVNPGAPQAFTVPPGFGGWKELAVYATHPRLNSGGADDQDLMVWGIGVALNSYTETDAGKLEFFGRIDEKSFTQSASSGGQGIVSGKIIRHFSDGDVISFHVQKGNSAGNAISDDFFVRLSLRHAQVTS